MSRMRRIEYYGAIYHIIQRGNNKTFIFEEDQNKMEILKILGEVKEIFDFHLLGYVIMDNHYHFIIKTHNIPISQIMHRINTRYAKYYNFHKNRTGSPFEGRYTGILVQNEIYLLRLIKYIHNNPVYASICSSMEKYKWSSDMFYRMNVENLVNIDGLLDMFSENRLQAISNYVDLMGEVPDDFTASKNEFEEGNLIGDKDFKESFHKSKNEPKIPLDEILKSVCPTMGDYRLIKDGSRKRYLTKYKQKYSEKALEYGYTIIDISKNIALTDSAIRKIL